VKEKLLTESKKSITEKSTKRNVIYDEFANMYRNNRLLAGQILTKITTSKGKDKKFNLDEKNFHSKGAEPKFSESTTQTSSSNMMHSIKNNVESSICHSRSGSLLFKTNNERGDRSKMNYTLKLKNSTGIKNYKKCREYSKIILPDII